LILAVACFEIRAQTKGMIETPEELRLKIKRYRELIQKLGAKNQAGGRLQTLIDELEHQLRIKQEK